FGNFLWAGTWIPGTANDGCDRFLWSVLRHTGPPAEEPAARHDGSRLSGFHRRYRAFQTRYPALITLRMHRSPCHKSWHGKKIMVTKVPASPRSAEFVLPDLLTQR